MNYCILICESCAFPLLYTLCAFCYDGGVTRFPWPLSGNGRGGLSGPGWETPVELGMEPGVYRDLSMVQYYRIYPPKHQGN